MVPLGSVATFQHTTGPYRVPRYNLFPAAEIQGDAAPGDRAATALAAMEQLAAKATCPTASATSGPISPIEQKQAGNTGDPGVRGVGGVRVPGAGGAIRELVAAAVGDPDRADVSAGGDVWPT